MKILLFKGGECYGIYNWLLGELAIKELGVLCRKGKYFYEKYFNFFLKKLNLFLIIYFLLTSK